MTYQDKHKNKDSNLPASGCSAVFKSVALGLAASLLLTLTATSAFADRAKTDRAKAGYIQTFTEYARVLRVEPLFHHVTIREPQRICRPAINHQRHDRLHNRHHLSNRSQRTRANSGFVSGRISSAVSREASRPVDVRSAADIDRGNRHTSSRHRHHGRKSQHCTTTLQTRIEQKQDGYEVTYRYRGQRYKVHTSYHPGDRLAIQVTIDPRRR